jgi:glycosyltransferase involved in cell wall biosynthesis
MTRATITGHRPADTPGAARPLGPRVSVVMPTLNEAANLPTVFEKMPDAVHEVIVVDGYSTDETVTVAQEIDPRVRIVLQDRPGKGNALAHGFAAVRGDIVVTLDADCSADPGEISRFVDVLVEGADFAKGSRYLREAGGGSTDLTLIRSGGNRVLTGHINLLFGTSYTDLCYGYNAFWAHCLPHIHLDCDGFEVETVMNIRVARAGLTVREVPSFEYPRLHGVSKLNAMRDGLRIEREVVRELFNRRRDPVAPTLAERREHPRGVPAPLTQAERRACFSFAPGLALAA